ncbi:hypothetical protein RM863_29205 [Streptomyces sp. DSM 41014]|uniref:Uncharacterized protein n=1 Tax=Streptomyces hintoniae TaxID=3075521 RepID=A0ABU2USE1_9ACTN|nr:hypothetical protein [Streptomyces sp. DSM 41014]MDT0476210.1 hypothetical protein [Streptomyces sp. DSM 41014]
MSETYPEQPLVPAALAAARPTAAEVEAAARLLAHAWAPGVLLPGDPGYDQADTEEDPDDYCGCAGQDEDGESRGCNCGDGCVCESCEYYRYARRSLCYVKNCGRRPAFRVVRFALTEQHVQEPVASGAVCPHAQGEPHHCTPTTVFIAAGPTVQEYDYQPACSLAHAAELRDRLQQHTPSSNTLYRIEAWTYRPHDRELPSPLPQLASLTDQARDAAAWAVRAHAESRSPAYWLETARRAVALAAFNAAQPLEQPDADDGDFDDQPAGPAQEEPAEGPW